MLAPKKVSKPSLFKEIKRIPRIGPAGQSIQENLEELHQTLDELRKTVREAKDEYQKLKKLKAEILKAIESKSGIPLIYGDPAVGGAINPFPSTTSNPLISDFNWFNTTTVVTSSGATRTGVFSIGSLA